MIRCCSLMIGSGGQLSGLWQPHSCLYNICGFFFLSSDLPSASRYILAETTQGENNNLFIYLFICFNLGQNTITFQSLDQVLFCVSADVSLTLNIKKNIYISLFPYCLFDGSFSSPSYIHGPNKESELLGTFQSTLVPQISTYKYSIALRIFFILLR